MCSRAQNIPVVSKRLSGALVRSLGLTQITSYQAHCDETFAQPSLSSLKKSPASQKRRAASDSEVIISGTAHFPLFVYMIIEGRLYFPRENAITLCRLVLRGIAESSFVMPHS